MFYSYRYHDAAAAVALAQQLVKKKRIRREIKEICREFPAKINYTFGWDSWLGKHNRRDTKAEVLVRRGNNGFSMFINGSHVHVQSADENVLRVATWLLLTQIELEGLGYCIELLSGKIEKPKEAQLVFVFFKDEEYFSGNMNGFLPRSENGGTEVISKDELVLQMQRYLLERQDFVAWLTTVPELPTFFERIIKAFFKLSSHS